MHVHGSPSSGPQDVSGYWTLVLSLLVWPHMFQGSPACPSAPTSWSVSQIVLAFVLPFL